MNATEHMFPIDPQQIALSGFDLQYHLTPWDRPYLPGNAAVISGIAVESADSAADGFRQFRVWCDANDVCLVVSRVAQDRLRECHFLESQGFRFIELNHRPYCRDLSRYSEDPTINISQAGDADEPALTDMAHTIFSTGRMQLDPQIGNTIGDQRYAGWIGNAFRNPDQHVFVFSTAGQLIGFVVEEHPAPAARFWSLIGLSKQFAGRGLGRRTWQSLLARYARAGVTEVSTSISSQNLPVVNLYASLGFRFPQPEIILHWCPRGPLLDSRIMA